MPLPILSLEELLRLPPMIFGTIRWKISVGKPTGDPCASFDIQVEEHTATEFRDAGGGNIIPEPGTGIFKLVSNSVSCWAQADQGDEHIIKFKVSGLHFNMPFDGYYRITPRLRGNWRPSGIFAIGYRTIEPISANVVLKKDDPTQSCEFEVVRRSWFSGRRL
ncbi:MAG: hypothetical protein AABZ00_15985 [Chloroflexota bacterium]|mgnify:CR=1 FL=1